MEDSKISDNDFLYNYQINHFKEDLKDPHSTANLRRKNMFLSLAYSNQSLDNATSCHIFNDQLSSYFKLVDDRSGINNYAKATLDLVANVKTVSKTWKSGLCIDDPKWKNPWKPPPGKCSNPTKSGYCGNFTPPESAIPILLGSSVVARGNEHQQSIVLSDQHGSIPAKFSSAGASNLLKPQLITGGNTKNKASLYSFYHDSKPGPSVEKMEVCAPLKRNRELMNNSYSSRKNFSNSSNRENNSNDEEEVESKSGIYHRFPGGKGYYRNCKPLVTPLNNFRSQENIEDNSEETRKAEFQIHFKTAGQQLKISNQQKKGNNSGRSMYDESDRRIIQPQPVKKYLGGKRTVTSKFVPPVRNSSQEEEYYPRDNSTGDVETELDERLKNIEPKMVELIKNEIMDTGSSIGWDDIAGLEFAKTTIQEIVVWPMLRPDIFTGLRRPPKGILLFGPPGTGKTLIGKCIASQSKSTFFSISASSLTSKWIGDGEKMVRALFAVARCHQPAVVFIDEIDSLLSQRSDTEHESSRRIKTEFLVQLVSALKRCYFNGHFPAILCDESRRYTGVVVVSLLSTDDDLSHQKCLDYINIIKKLRQKDGAGTGEEDRILVIGATNRPQELDEAARRRLVKRLYIPLPDRKARTQLVANLMKSERNTLTSEETEEISSLTDGYSGADMKNLCQEACLGPIRSIASMDMFQISADQVRPVNIEDFKLALKRVKSSVSSQDLEIYLKWDQQYGCGGGGF